MDFASSASSPVSYGGMLYDKAGTPMTDVVVPSSAGKVKDYQFAFYERLHSIVTIDSPMNGTTAYDMLEDPDFDPAAVKVPWWSKKLARLMSLRLGAAPDGRDKRDYAAWDMHLDQARAFNERCAPLPGVAYFSIPCSASVQNPDGTWRPRRGMEPLFYMRACQIGAYAGRTAGGMAVDETWRENDGLVNTVSARAPSGAPSRPLDRNSIGRGLWNVFPTVEGDHMYLQGGLLHRHDIRPFYLDLLTLISGIRPPDARSPAEE